MTELRPDFEETFVRAPCGTDLPLDHPADATFQAALGVVQNRKNLDLLAVHHQGRKLVAYEKAKLSNPMVHMLVVHEGTPTVVSHAVGTDPRTRRALLDGRANEKAATRYLESVAAVLEGSEQAPVTHVDNHYVQKKERVPWTDSDQEPDIGLGFSWGSFLA